ncbi:MAG: hypothetical protein ACK5IC_07380 [Moheibacter sp.]
MSQNPNEQLNEIRSLMERSTRFMSLSGWTGIMAGIYSLIGAVAAYYIIFIHNSSFENGRKLYENYAENITDLFSPKNKLLLLIAILVIIFSATTAFYQSNQKAKKQGIKLWNSTSKRLFIQVALPLITGGIFCVALLFYGHAGLIAPAMLIFYGLALLNGSKYTLKEFHSLALCEIALGLISLFFIGYGLYFWTIGFGILHIIYGILMQKRYK